MNVEELCEPKELSGQILNDLAARYAKNGPPLLYPLFDIRLPDRSIESYGEEPKRFIWSKLSSEYKWEECL